MLVEGYGNVGDGNVLVECYGNVLVEGMIMWVMVMCWWSVMVMSWWRG